MPRALASSLSVSEERRTLLPVGLDVAAMEQDLRRIPSVHAARVIADLEGNPVQVQVLAAPGAQTIDLVREVQTVASARQRVEIDGGIVQVIQLDQEDEESEVDLSAGGDDGAEIESDGDGTVRIVLDRVRVDRHDLRCSAVVALRVGDEVVEGNAHGPGATSSAHRVLAEATLDALRRVHPHAERAAIESVDVFRTGRREVALAVVIYVVPPHEELLTGSAPVRAAGHDDAIARAVLDACSRRLAMS